jgi:hypothetical protein
MALPRARASTSALAAAALVLVLGLALGMTGCAAAAARERLQRGSQVTGGAFALVNRSDFRDSDTSSGTPTSLGSAMLRDVAIADGGIATFLHEHGLPDAVAVRQTPLGLQIDLAYLGTSKVVTLQHGPSEAMTARSAQVAHVVAERAMTDADLDQVDPERRLARAAERLQEHITRSARVQRIVRRVARAVDADRAEPNGHGWGFLTAGTTPASNRLFGYPPDTHGLFVASVDSEGAVGGTLNAGDLITAVNGRAVSPEALQTLADNTTVELTLLRHGAPITQSISAEPWPRSIASVVIEDDDLAAFATGNRVAITTGLLSLLENDDEVAAVVAHEVAHIADDHVGTRDPQSVSGSGLVMRYNRDQERRADVLGIHYARAAGYRPEAAITVIERLQQAVPEDLLSQYRDVHPPYPERIKMMRRAIAEQQ